MVNWKKQAKSPTRLTREAWLEKALEVLRRQGNAGLQIENFTRKLGVTKGSFYWHFKDRDDFRRAILDYWDERYTRRVAAHVEAEGRDACSKLRRTIEIVTQENLSGYDEPIDGWVAHQPAIAARVQAVYKFRYEFIRSLFADLGFRGLDLDTRTVALLGLLKAEWTMPPGNKARPTAARIDSWVKFFTRR